MSCVSFSCKGQGEWGKLHGEWGKCGVDFSRGTGLRTLTLPLRGSPSPDIAYLYPPNLVQVGAGDWCARGCVGVRGAGGTPRRGLEIPARANRPACAGPIIALIKFGRKSHTGNAVRRFPTSLHSPFAIRYKPSCVLHLMRFVIGLRPLIRRLVSRSAHDYRHAGVVCVL